MLQILEIYFQYTNCFNKFRKLRLKSIEVQGFKLIPPPKATKIPALKSDRDFLWELGTY